MDALQQRSDEIEKRKGIYQWNQSLGGELPSVLRAKYENLPADEKFSTEKSEDFIQARNRVAKVENSRKFLTT